MVSTNDRDLELSDLAASRSYGYKRALTPNHEIGGLHRQLPSLSMLFVVPNLATKARIRLEYMSSLRTGFLNRYTWGSRPHGDQTIDQHASSQRSLTQKPQPSSWAWAEDKTFLIQRHDAEYPEDHIEFLGNIKEQYRRVQFRRFSGSYSITCLPTFECHEYLHE